MSAPTWLWVLHLLPSSASLGTYTITLLYSFNLIDFGSGIGDKEPNSTDNPTIFHTFEEDFDLTVLVGKSPTAQFQVDSHAMKRACKAWKAMLYGDFTEKKPTVGDWIVSFPEDDWMSFKIALYQIHGDGHEVPRKPDAYELYNLLVFIDKWNLFRVFEPWRKIWDRALMVQRGRDKSSAWFQHALSAAWFLGSNTNLKQFVKTLAQHSYIDEEGQFKLCYTEDAAAVDIGHHIDPDIFVGMLSAYHPFEPR